MTLTCSLDQRFMKFSGRSQSAEEFFNGIKRFLTCVKYDLNLYDTEIPAGFRANVSEMEKLIENILDDDENNDSGTSVLSKEINMFMKKTEFLPTR